MKSFSLVVFVIFSIVLASVENKVKANICAEGLGACSQCDERCKAKRGPTGEGTCDRFQLCTCTYQCGPPSPAPPGPPHKICFGGAGTCSAKCGTPCCNQLCAQKFPGGSGYCDRIGQSLLCKCEYPC